MKSTITTEGVDRAGRSGHWHETIASAYFPLDLTFRRPEDFDGRLTNWELGQVSLSRLTSDALLYRRLPRHFREPGPEEFLVTIPAGRKSVSFRAARRSAPTPAPISSSAATSPMSSAMTTRPTCG